MCIFNCKPKTEAMEQRGGVSVPSRVYGHPGISKDNEEKHFTLVSCHPVDSNIV